MGRKIAFLKMGGKQRRKRNWVLNTGILRAVNGRSTREVRKCFDGVHMPFHVDSVLIMIDLIR